MMEFFASESNVFIFLVMIGIVGFLAMISQTKKQNKMLEEIFQRHVLKYNGTVESGGFLDMPRLKIHGEDAETELFIERIGSGKGRRTQYFTVFSAAFHASIRYKIRIYREHRLFGIGTVFGQDIKIDNPEFDGAFVIQGTDGAIVRNFLIPDIQAKFLLMKDYDPTLEIRDNKLKIRIPRLLTDDQPYDLLMDTGLAMIKRIREIG